jgi:hypothetical protein
MNSLCNTETTGPLFFVEKTVTDNVYMNMLEQFVLPQLQELKPNIVFQQDEAPPHLSLLVRHFLNRCLPGCWIGRDGPTAWPPRSPDLTHLDFLWGYAKDVAHINPVTDLQDLHNRITNAIWTITPDMLKNTWIEFDYRLDIFRTMKGAHVKTVKTSIISESVTAIRIKIC